MSTQNSDKQFTGSIPEIYENYLVPLIFEEYARDLADRVKQQPVASVLEIAAGTGVVTRAVVDALESQVSITATDLNQAMLDHAASVRADENVTWREADAQALPFENDCFDVVLCQFGVMFFPERVKAYSEAFRVLKPGGRYIFNVWDKIENNEFAETVTESLASVFPGDPPRFLARTPHGYFDHADITSDLKAGGFNATLQFDTVTAKSIAQSPSIPAIAYCQGTPLRNEIESRDATLLEHATKVATSALTSQFGEGVIEGKIQAHVVTVTA